MSSVSTGTITHFAPYIFFYGRCEEALQFYKSVFNGSYELQRQSDGPFGDQTSAEWRDKVMHSTFVAPGITFMASDGQEPKAIDPAAGNISLSVTTATNEEGDRIFAGLAQGGTIAMPLDAVPWGGRFGVLHDRFGIEWMISAP